MDDLWGGVIGMMAFGNSNVLSELPFGESLVCLGVLKATIEVLLFPLGWLGGFRFDWIGCWLGAKFGQASRASLGNCCGVVLGIWLK